MFKNISLIFLIISFVISFFVSVHFKRKKKKIWNLLIQALINKKYSSFNKMTQNKTVRSIISPFDLLLLRFNSYILQKDYSKLKEIFDHSTNIYMTNKQKLYFYGQALQFFAEKKDYKRSKICLNKVQNVKGFDNSKRVLNELYEVMLLDNVKFIKIIEARLPKESAARTIEDYRLLEHLYGVKKEFRVVDNLRRLQSKKVDYFYNQ